MSVTPTNNRIASVLESIESAHTEAKDANPEGIESAQPLMERTAADGDHREHVEALPNPPEDRGGDANLSTPTTVASLDVAKQKPPDPFDPAQLRINQDYAAGLGIKKLLTAIPVRKPSKEDWVRTHPDPAFRLVTGVIELKKDRETYLIHPAIRDLVAAEPTSVTKVLIVTIDRDGVLSLWPIRMPNPEGKIDDWNRTALEAADAARDNWVCVTANMNLAANDIRVAEGIKDKPNFPDLSLRDILGIAFKGKVIDSMNHMVLRKLRGEL